MCMEIEDLVKALHGQIDELATYTAAKHTRWLNGRIDALAAENNSLREKLVASREKLITTGDALTNVRLETVRLRNDLDTTTGRHYVLKTNLDEMTAERDSARLEVARLRSALDVANARLGRLERELDETVPRDAHLADKIHRAMEILGEES